MVSGGLVHIGISAKHAEFVHAEISSKTNEGACENRWERFLTTLEKLVVESEKTAMTYPYGWVW